MQLPSSSSSQSASSPGPTHRGVLWVGLPCDVRCKFCYDEHIPASSKVWLSLADAKTALDKFRHYYFNSFVDFMGGEPTLHPRMPEIVRYSAEIGLRPTIITHGMHLAARDRALAYADAGINDFLVSIHGIGETVRAIHGRGRNNSRRQIQALDNLRELGIPFRFNVTMIRDNAPQLSSIVELADEKGARVVNFLTFNPYFEWRGGGEIEFQVRHSQVATHLAAAIDRCVQLGIEANVRYMPLCQLKGREQHVYTGYQLPYDSHEWDYNSWYDQGVPGSPSPGWYRHASDAQRARHNYVHVEACDGCAMRTICDGFHAQYAARWGGGEAAPYEGEPVTDVLHFVRHQTKYPCSGDEPSEDPDLRFAAPLAMTQFLKSVGNRAAVRIEQT